MKKYATAPKKLSPTWAPPTTARKFPTPRMEERFCEPVGDYEVVIADGTRLPDLMVFSPDSSAAYYDTGLVYPNGDSIIGIHEDEPLGFLRFPQGDP